MTGQCKFTKNNIKPMKSDHFRCLSVNIKTQFIPQSINLSQGKKYELWFLYLSDEIHGCQRT